MTNSSAEVSGCGMRRGVTGNRRDATVILFRGVAGGRVVTRVS